MSLFDFARPKHAGLSQGMRKILDEFDRLNLLPIETLTAEEARRQPMIGDAKRILQQRQGLGQGTGTEIPAREVTLAVSEGSVLARLYGQAMPGDETPLVLYWHGGGFVRGEIDDYEASARAVARGTHCLLLSCAYRQGPEHRFPAAHEDAWRAYQWVLHHAAALGADRRRLAVMGEGAGANLALHVALRARDLGVETPLSQILIYPVVGTDMGTASYRDHGHAAPLNRAILRWMFDHYLKDAADQADPQINILANELWGLPPTLIVAAEIDPLYSEGVHLAERLAAAEVPVTHKCYSGVTHDFFGLAPLVPEASQAQAAVVAELRKRLAYGLRGRISHALGS